MSKDTRSTIVGIGIGCLIQVLVYIEAGIDIHSPLWWAGLASTIASFIKGYYHNKPQTVPAPQPPEA